MATGGSDFLTAVQEHLLVCEVCQEDFQSPGRLPRVLPCFHCFCGPCLEQLDRDGSLTCPKCRRDIPVEGTFPVETTRMALLDMKHLSQNQDSKQCEGCSDGATATSRCQECAEFLCENCSFAHSKMKIFKDHAVLSLSEAATAPRKLVQSTEKCEMHQDEKLKFFCQGCSVPACSTCAILLHSGHKMTELNPALEKERKEVLSWCKKIEEELPKFETKAQSSGADLKSLDTRLQERVTAVQELFSGIVTKVMARQEEVLADLRSKVKADRLKLEELHARDESLLDTALTTVDYGKRVVSLGLPSQLLGHADKMESAYRSLQKQGQTQRKSVLCHRIDESEMPAMNAALEKIGSVSSLPFALPEFRFDGNRCHHGTSLENGGCSLVNKASLRRAQSRRSRRGVNGTCTTEAAPDTPCYWQVRCVIPRETNIEEEEICEVGVATQDALQATVPSWYFTTNRQGYCSLRLSTNGADVNVSLCRAAGKASTCELSARADHELLDCTFGFLVDHSSNSLHIIDVDMARELFHTNIDIDEPLWPVCCVVYGKKTRAEVRMELQSGPNMKLSPAVVGLLKSLV